MDKKQKPEQQKTNLILRIVGGVIAAAGLLMAIFGFVDISSVSESGEMPRIWLLMLGLPCIALGGMLLTLSFRRVGSGNGANANGGHISPAAVTPSAYRPRAAVVCPFCGEAIDADAHFATSAASPCASSVPTAVKPTLSMLAFAKSAANLFRTARKIRLNFRRMCR